MERVVIRKSQIKSEIENGMTRKELGEKYGLSTGQVNKALKQMGLSSMRAASIKFEIELDDIEAIPDVQQPVYSQEEFNNNQIN